MNRTLAVLDSPAPVACCAPLAGGRLEAPEATGMAALFKALSDPHRIQIVNLLSNSPEPVCVCDVTAAVGLSQPTTSFHLRKLVGAGLLAREQRGTWAYYSLIPEAMKALRRIVDTTGPKGRRGMRT
jgi:ArsR family transcriptional regulator, arsenate/arsenite/antimonite-responsive transcriptional repressor